MFLRPKTRLSVNTQRNSRLGIYRRFGVEVEEWYSLRGSLCEKKKKSVPKFSRQTRQSFAYQVTSFFDFFGVDLLAGSFIRSTTGELPGRGAVITGARGAFGLSVLSEVSGEARRVPN